MSQDRALSVGEVVHLAKRALEEIRVRVVGEVSEYADKPGYKAVYFSLSDGGAVLPCLMWRNDFTASGVVLQEGILVEVVGRMSVYPAKGRMQFQVRTMILAGEGVLRMQVAALARKLEDEGLMRPERKRALPDLPGRIGLVTSPRGKAVHDVIRTLRRRYPLGELVVVGVAVEGRGAPSAIVAGIERVAQAGVDVLIVCRGGGSYEDLMPFNDEGVARAIADCSVPVVTGIGHEPDTTIADMVADVRTSTPTAAAEMVAPSVMELAVRLQHLSSGLVRSLGIAVSTASHRCGTLAARPVFRDPAALLAPQAQRLDLVADGLSRALPSRLEHDRLRLAAARAGFISVGGRLLERVSAKTAGAADRLHDLSPLGILGRGYAICYGTDGKAVRSAAMLSRGDGLDVRFAIGSARCTVDTVEMEG